MQRIRELLGGKTRFAVIEALAEASQPMTAYQIAIAKGLDPAATYRCLAEFSELGIARPVMKEGRKQTSYALSADAGKAAAKFLKLLKRKMAERIQAADLEVWISPEMKAERMSRVVKLARGVNGYPPAAFAKRRTQAEKKDAADPLSKRIQGELAALVASSKTAFEGLFEQADEMTFVLKEQ